MLHEASSHLFAEVGKYTPGKDYPAAQFVRAFQYDRYRSDGLNKKPEFFTINGQSGWFAAHNPYITSNHRVGEPTIIRILNAGLCTNSLHIHANHVYVTSANGIVEENPIWLDTYTARPLDVVDWVVPYMRPPDVPNERGIGYADKPLISIPNPAIPGSVPHPVWPPTEELNTHFPEIGTKAGDVDISVRLSPICYPMHDYSETSQSAQGGNYGLGMMAGLEFIGDRNTPGGVVTFPGAPTVHGPDMTGPAAGPDGSQNNLPSKTTRAKQTLCAAYVKIKITFPVDVVVIATLFKTLKNAMTPLRAKPSTLRRLFCMSSLKLNLSVAFLDFIGRIFKFIGESSNPLLLTTLFPL